MIKYRGLTVDTKQWVYGYLVEFEDMSIIFECKGSVLISSHSCKPLEYISSDFWVEVIPETIGIFTGILDTNGQEIYGSILIDGKMSKGGDICGLMNDIQGYEDRKAVCINKQGCFWFDELDEEGKPTDYCLLSYKFEQFQVEVIGNIYEHPELLEGSK